MSSRFTQYSTGTRKTELLWTAKPKYHFFWLNGFSFPVFLVGIISLVGVWAVEDFSLEWTPVYFPCILLTATPILNGLVLFGTRYKYFSDRVCIEKTYIFLRKTYSLPLENIWSGDITERNGEISVLWGYHERWWSGLQISSSVQRKNEPFQFVFLHKKDWHQLRPLLPQRIKIKRSAW